ncbi:hypothetical protein KVT40_002221 [Elsinoe batatas]|uniref:Uncharacterized protein n=1 Tax=Elsinoe batatas TaxID=2601811 RepID=A0A8K0PJJ8_9PEZI|nr:hypothetical protein KVT40_002221 [Elsinoe batatas]
MDLPLAFSFLPLSVPALFLTFLATDLLPIYHSVFVPKINQVLVVVWKRFETAMFWWRRRGRNLCQDVFSRRAGGECAMFRDGAGDGNFEIWRERGGILGHGSVGGGRRNGRSERGKGVLDCGCDVSGAFKAFFPACDWGGFEAYTGEVSGALLLFVMPVGVPIKMSWNDGRCGVQAGCFGCILRPDPWVVEMWTGNGEVGRRAGKQVWLWREMRLLCHSVGQEVTWFGEPDGLVWYVFDERGVVLGRSGIRAAVVVVGDVVEEGAGVLEGRLILRDVGGVVVIVVVRCVECVAMIVVLVVVEEMVGLYCIPSVVVIWGPTALARAGGVCR